MDNISLDKPYVVSFYPLSQGGVHDVCMAIVKSRKFCPQNWLFIVEKGTGKILNVSDSSHFI